ncbi:IS5 family transposase [Geopseudomonas aromaticivorans]
MDFFDFGVGSHHGEAGSRKRSGAQHQASAFRFECGVCGALTMDRVVPWKGLIALIEPHYPKGEGGRPAYPLMAMLRVHLMQNWFGYSDPAMEEALYETTILRQFAGLSLERIPDETTILNFRRLLEKYELAAGILGVINGYLGDRGLSLRQGTIVDATLIHAPSSTKNQDGKRDPEMHQTKKGNQYYFGMKAHIGVDDESGLVHHVVGTAANVADVTQVDQLLHGEENVVCADAGYTGVEKRSEHEGREVIWQVAARRSTYKKLDKRSALYKAKRKIEKAKAQVRAKVEHPFRVIKRQFGYVKTRFRGLAKNTAQLVTLFALSNLWMARRHLLMHAGEVRL